MSEYLPFDAKVTGTLTLRQYTVTMLYPIAAALLDHVELATPSEAAGYVGAVVLWLSGVAVLVLRKVRTSR